MPSRADKAVKVLVVEDSEDDARLAMRALRSAGFDASYERVDSASAMQAALARQTWDAVISDYNMPGFTGLDALGILKASGLDLPFILVSGRIGEETAVEAMKAGASDYVMKGNLARLAPALERDLQEAAVRTEHRRAEIELRKLALAVRQSGTGIVITDPAGTIEFVNPKFEAMTGYSTSELVGKNPRFLKSGTTPLETYRNLWETITAGKEWRGEIQNRKKTGDLYFENQHISPVLDDSGRILHFIAVKEDVTEKKRAEEELRASESLKSAILESSLDCIITIDREGKIVEFNPMAESTFGFTREHALGESIAELLIPPRLRDAHRRGFAHYLATGEGSVLGKRLELAAMRADGTEFPIELSIAPIRTPTAQLLTGFIRDITERRQADDKIRRLNRVYAVLSGINALIVRVQDRDELFSEACRIAVEAGGFRMAWLGVVDREAMQVKPAAWYGAGPDYIQLMPLGLSEAVPEEYGLAGRAVNERNAMVTIDMTRDPRVLLKEEALKHGVRSLVVLPLLAAEEAVAVLALYAAEPGFFDEQEMKLLRELAGDIAFALDHLEKAEKVHYLAYYDSQTGLANRALFHERLLQVLAAAAREGRRVALIILDVQHFKSINDTFGRQAGDMLLKRIAERMTVNAWDASSLARTGADQFAITVLEVSSEDELVRGGERRLNDIFDQPFRIGDTDLRVSARLGIALFPEDGADADALFRNAEAALKKAKERGERYLFFEQRMTERVAEKLTLENKLRQALEKNEFVLHYQPKVEVETRRIVGLEALIRWQSPELGLVAPMEFIPLLEETGLILPVGSWALNRAALDHRGWAEQGLNPPRVAVNVSPIQLRQRDFVQVLHRAILDGIAPTAIDLELTEGVIMEDIQANNQKLQDACRLGVRIAIDDFGTGYSSLAYLAKLPVHTLKIDRSFVISMLHEPQTMTLVRTIVSLAHSLRLTVVAEGVDSEQQAGVLRLLLCDEMQGYLFHKPLPLQEITALLRASAEEKRPH